MKEVDDDAAIDVCRNYIEEKKCSYLAKEDQVVYYSSDTGRVSDAKWHKMTLSQTHRIIQSMYTSYSFGADKLLQAFQELGEVYERGVKSRHKVRSGLFNYHERSNNNIMDDVLTRMLEILLSKDYFCVRMSSIHSLASEIIKRLDLPDHEFNDRKINALERVGYDARTESRRPRIGGALISCAIYRGYKPSDFKKITRIDFDHIIEKVVREFK